jgi:hypothetical protein
MLPNWAGAGDWVRFFWGFAVESSPEKRELPVFVVREQAMNWAGYCVVNQG